MSQEIFFSNLFAAITAEENKNLKSFIASLNEVADIDTLLQPYWFYSDLLPKSKKPSKNRLTGKYEIKGFETIAQLKAYIMDRKAKAVQKSLDKELLHLQTVAAAPDLSEITVSMEWKKSRIWGSNPKAEAKVSSISDFKRYESGSIGGCGYDKGSTAVAEAINQSNSFLKAMYLKKEQSATTKNRELFGYGSGYGILPRLEGGVGVSCYPKIFDTIGFDFKTIASGNTYDVYSITKK